MSSKTYETFSTKATPQSEPIPGEPQVANSAGGYVYALDKWAAFERFLILGSEGGTYYIKERPLTAKNALNTIACIEEDGRRAVDTIVNISDAGRAPKNTPAEFALALAASAKDPGTRAYALAALPKVCRIPTHLFHFLSFCKQHRRWSRMLRRAVADWYARWDENKLAYELVKYQSRDGWANRDALRLAHLKGHNSAALRWAVGAALDVRDVKRSKDGAHVNRYPSAGPLPSVIAAFQEAQTADTTRLCFLIREYGLTREMVPSEALTKREVWEALLEQMPLTALLRNLGNMSKVGLLTPMSAAAQIVNVKLGDALAYKKQRVHPVAVLIALKTYAQGRGILGSGEWAPVQSVVDALDAGFYTAFGAVEPTNKRIMLALDVSGSMTSDIGGFPLSCREAAAAMALVTAAVEPNHVIVGFTSSGAVSRRSQWAGYQAAISPLKISPRQRLDDVVRYTSGLPFGGTDCALPMIYASHEKLDVDAFVVITDSETWAGDVHPKQALADYRRERGIAAKQVVVGMTATEFTIADPNDPLSLDVVGFDASTPQAISEFVR